MTVCAAALDDYLPIRRQLGFKLKETGRLLEQFVELPRAGRRGARHHRARARVGDARCTRAPAPVAPAARDGARVRAVPGDDRSRRPRFPPRICCRATLPRVAPYIYSPAEITALMAAARAADAAAARRDVRDADRAAGRHRPAARRGARARPRRRRPRRRRAARPRRQAEQAARGAAARHHHRGAARLRRAARPLCPQPSTPAFFVSTRGAAADRAARSAQTFAKLIRQVGLEGAGERTRPRAARSPPLLRCPHAARLASAPATTSTRKLPLLSTYLGHVDPASTYWYLQAVARAARARRATGSNGCSEDGHDPARADARKRSSPIG